MQTPPVEVVAAHPALITWLLGITIAIALGSMIYHIRKSDKNNENQWTALNDLLSRVSNMEGKCEARHKG